jgi:hypothetical protein
MEDTAMILYFRLAISRTLSQKNTVYRSYAYEQLKLLIIIFSAAINDKSISFAGLDSGFYVGILCQALF